MIFTHLSLSSKHCSRMSTKKDKVQLQFNINQQPSEYYISEQTSENKSSSIEEYYNFFEKFGANKNLAIQQKLDVLKQNKIHVDMENSLNKEIMVISCSEGYRVLQLFVKMSIFRFELTVLNFQSSSDTSRLINQLSYGSFGSVYEFRVSFEEAYVVKNIKYLSKFTSNIENAIYEFCFNKLFSALQIGPKVSNLLGFDLVIYSNSIQFSLELCRQLRRDRLSDLLEVLKIMHNLNIVHGDIKPQNIMWSPTFKKNVFIDFGFTRFVKEKIGFSTYTSFFGTFKYSSPQMLKCFHRSGFGYVDLYYNDVYALQNIILAQIEQKHKKQFQTSINGPNELGFQNKLKNFKLLRFLFDRDYDKIAAFLSENKKFILSPAITNFLTEVRPSVKMYFAAVKIANAYGESERTIETLKDYHTNKIININKTHDCSAIFRQRLKNVSTQLKTRDLNAAMQFVMVLSNEDVTLRRLEHKKKDAELLKCFKAAKAESWQALLRFCYNPYTSLSQIVYMFDKVRHQLKLQPWDFVCQPEFEIFFKAWAISKAVLNKHNIDVFALRRQLGLAWFEHTIKEHPSFLEDMKLSRQEVDFLQQNWHMIAGINHRYESNQIEVHDRIELFISKSAVIKRPSALFECLKQYLYAFNTGHHLQNFHLFLQNLLTFSSAFQSRIARQISHCIYRDYLNFSLSLELKQNCTQFFKHSYNSCFEFCLCRNAYFMQLVAFPFLKQQDEKVIIRGLEKIFQMKNEQQIHDYFYKDLTFFLILVGSKKDPKNINIKSKIYFLLRESYNGNYFKIADSQECRTYLVLLIHTYNREFEDTQYLVEVFKDLGTSMQKCKIPIIRLQYQILKIRFFMHKFGEYRINEAYHHLKKLLDREQLYDIATKCSYTFFTNLIFALILSHISGQFNLAYHQKISQFIKKENFQIEHLVIKSDYLVAVCFYYLKEGQYQETFNFIIQILKRYQIDNEKKLHIHMYLYISTRLFLTMLVKKASTQTILTVYLTKTVDFVKNNHYKQTKPISCAIILMQFIFDCIYLVPAPKYDSELFRLISFHLPLLFRWTYYWLPASCHSLKQRILVKFSNYVIDLLRKGFISLPQLKQKSVNLKKLRNTQFCNEAKRILQFLNEIKASRKPDPSCISVRAKVFSLIYSHFIYMNQNKQKSVQIIQSQFNPNILITLQYILNAKTINFFTQQMNTNFSRIDYSNQVDMIKLQKEGDCIFDVFFK